MGIAQRALGVGDDGDFLDRLGVLLLGGHQGMAHLVIGHQLLSCSVRTVPFFPCPAMTSSKDGQQVVLVHSLAAQTDGRRAASLTRLARSAPTAPAVAWAILFRSTSSARRILRVWTWRVARRPARWAGPR